MQVGTPTQNGMDACFVSLCCSCGGEVVFRGGGNVIRSASCCDQAVCRCVCGKGKHVAVGLKATGN